MLQPIGDRVLVEVAPKEAITASGIYIPETAQEKPQQGKVVAVGHGRYHDDTLVSFKDMGIEVGTKIMYKKHGFSTEDIKIEGKDFIIIASDDILGIIKS